MCNILLRLFKVRSSKLILFLLAIVYSSEIKAQILHTESFSEILDTSQFIKGSIVPDFKFKSQKKDYIEFENTADIAFLFKQSAVTIGNKIELSKYGNETFLSGSYLYLEYRKILPKKISIEPYSQLHWSEAMGLVFKYAGGINLRTRILCSDLLGFYAGLGPFYEYERWNYEGVKDSLVPTNPKDTIVESFKLGAYLSFKWETDYNINLDISFYYQSKYDVLFESPRLASSIGLSYSFTDHFALIVKYQNIYDYDPVVPIDKLYNKVVSTIEISF